MSEEPLQPAPAPPPRGSPLVRAAVYYFGVVFCVGLLLGPVRVLWLEPWMGTALAVLAEAPLLILAMWFGARAAPAWAGFDGGWVSYLAIGVIALILQQIADLAVGFGLRNMTLADQAAYFGTPAGMIYVGTLIVFALTPMVRRLARGERT